MPPSTTPPARLRGITLVEILIVVAVFVILVSFALPAISVSSQKIDLLSATEQVEYSVRIARNTARSTETAVTLEIQPATETAGATIRYLTENTKNQALRQLAHQHEELDDGVLVQSEFASFVFDSRGMVEQPGSIILASREDSTLSESLNIQ